MIAQILAPPVARAGTVALAWSASSGPVAGYRVYYGQSSRNYASTSPTAPSLIGGTTYTTPNLPAGTYYFAVKAFDSAGNSSGYSNEVIETVAAAPTANFSASPVSGAAPLAVTFTNSSTNATAWSWNFGDGTTSTTKNPTKTYSSGGSYTVKLTATGPGGSVTTTKTNYITATTSASAPAASFTASPASGGAPLLVTFTDKSTGNVTSRTWNFGDGTTRTAQTAVKTYSTPGTYTARLTVSNASGSDSTTRTISATAIAPVAGFSATPTSGTAPLSTSFRDTSTGTITGYAWNFGDGSTSTASDPSHTYTKAGNYTVSLTATGPAGSNTRTQTSYIKVSAASAGGPVAAYNFEEASGATVVDASGKGNNGTISGATRTPAGKFGGALSFDGVNDWVTVNDSASLDLTGGMTLEAWVYPASAPEAWGTILMKETSGEAVYGLFSDGTSDKPTAHIANKSEAVGPSVLPNNAWSHLAATYNGATLILYVNGNEVKRTANSGNITVSTGRLMVGGNSVWGDYYKGRIDEIRVYNRALSATEIRADMAKPIP